MVPNKVPSLAVFRPILAPTARRRSRYSPFT